MVDDVKCAGVLFTSDPVTGTHTNSYILGSFVTGK